MRKSKASKGQQKAPVNPIRPETCALLRPRNIKPDENHQRDEESTGGISFLTHRAKQKSPISWDLTD